MMVAFSLKFLTFLKKKTTNKTFQQSENQDFFQHLLKRLGSISGI